MMQTKVCSKCNIEKILNEYTKSYNGCLYGVHSICKLCTSSHRREKTLLKNKGKFCAYPVPANKKCTGCGIEKENTEENFRINTRTKQHSPEELLLIHPHSRLAKKCKVCEAVLQKKNSKTPERQEKSRKWKKKNRDKILKRSKELRAEKLKDPEYVKQYKTRLKEKYTKNRTKFLESAKKYRNKNAEKINQNAKEYYWKYRDRINKRASAWRKRVKYSSSRQKKDPIYKLKCECRGRINWLTKRRSRVSNYKQTCPQTEKLIGCSVEFYYDHIEKQFTENMTWSNHGEWHVDHIIPLATAKTKEEVLVLNKWSNLQPLWSSDNIKKGSKIIDSSLYDYFTKEIIEYTFNTKENL